MHHSQYTSKNHLNGQSQYWRYKFYKNPQKGYSIKSILCHVCVGRLKEYDRAKDVNLFCILHWDKSYRNCSNYLRWIIKLAIWIKLSNLANSLRTIHNSKPLRECIKHFSSILNEHTNSWYNYKWYVIQMNFW